MGITMVHTICVYWPYFKFRGFSNRLPFGLVLASDRFSHSSHSSLSKLAFRTHGPRRERHVTMLTGRGMPPSSSQRTSVKDSQSRRPEDWANSSLYQTLRLLLLPSAPSQAQISSTLRLLLLCIFFIPACASWRRPVPCLRFCCWALF